MRSSAVLREARQL